MVITRVAIPTCLFAAEDVTPSLERAVKEVHVDDVIIPSPDGRVTLYGNLDVPHGATGVVLFAHGSGSGRKSPRNRQARRASFLYC